MLHPIRSRATNSSHRLKAFHWNNKRTRLFTFLRWWLPLKTTGLFKTLLTLTIILHSLLPYTVICVNKLSVAWIVSSIFHTLRPHTTPLIFVVNLYLSRLNLPSYVFRGKMTHWTISKEEDDPGRVNAQWRMTSDNSFVGSVETSSPSTACLLGIKKSDNPFTPVQDLKSVTDFKWVY